MSKASNINNNDGKAPNAPPETHAPVRFLERRDSAAYFNKLRLRLKLGVLAAFAAPIALLFLYFHYEFTFTMKEAAKLHLTSLAESQKNTVDLFLQERVVDIFSLFHANEFGLTPTQEEMDRYLQDLRQKSEAFVDVGLCNSQGVQVGYAGPFEYLYGKDYSKENWFASVMAPDVHYFISNMYLGFRNKPHFTIAVKQRIDNEACVMRATLDPIKFYAFLSNIGREKLLDSALLNAQGIYQVVNPHRGNVLGRGFYSPPRASSRGVEEMSSNGHDDLLAYAWLDEVPWALVVRQSFSSAYGNMYAVRRVIIAGTLVLVIVVVLLIIKTTDRLIGRAQKTVEAREELQEQLLHAAKLASVGELAAGVAHEINNPLAIIGATSGVIRDFFNPEFGVEWTPEMIQEELATIDAMVLRGRNITHKLLNFSRKNLPQLTSANINALLDDVVEGLKKQEFDVENIDVVRDYASDLPEILVDPDQISQVFLNLINNAGDAIRDGGTITLSTRYDKEWVYVSVADTGRGMTAEEMKKAFMPFYTSKEVGKGTGLGLSVSAGIVELLGGRIEVQSVPGKGSVFTIVLPNRIADE